MYAFLKVFVAASALASTAAAAHIHFINQDDVPRVIHSTNSESSLPVEEEALKPWGVTSVYYPDEGKWSGSIRVVGPGQKWHERSVHFEGTFSPDGSFWDVEAIDGPNDNTGIHWCYALEDFVRWHIDPLDKWQGSGCDTFPCPTAFRFPEDHNPPEIPGRAQVRYSKGNEFVCLVGAHDGTTYWGH